MVHHAERIHLKKRSYICKKCDKNFFFKNDLKKHFNAVHEGLRRFQCESCGFPCVSKQSLEKHRKNKHQKISLNCNYCAYSETSSKRFYNHYNTMHAAKNNEETQHFHVKCTLCHRNFDTQFILELHIEFDHQATKYWCDKCAKQFSTKKGLAFHISGVHEGLKPYACEQCGKTFPTNGSMQTHVKIVHLKTGSVKCQVCQQGVANVFYLRKHMREVHPDNNMQIQNK